MSASPPNPRLGGRGGLTQCRHEWRHGTQEYVRHVQAPVSHQALGLDCSANGLRRVHTAVCPYE